MIYTQSVAVFTFNCFRYCLLCYQVNNACDLCCELVILLFTPRSPLIWFLLPLVKGVMPAWIFKPGQTHKPMIHVYLQLQWIFQVHDAYTKIMKSTTHCLVSISDYESAPGSYTKKYCTTHSEKQLTEACQYCLKIFCISDRTEMLNKCEKASG